VSIAIVGCEEPLAQEARRITTIELHAALVNAAPDGATTQISAACSEQSARLRVIDPTTGKAVERTVALGQAAPSARARLLALAMAELVAASWSELENNPEPKAAAVAPLAPPSAREAARRVVAPRPIELQALADAQLLASRDVVLGGGARGELWLSERFFLRLDALFLYGEPSRATGSVALTMPSASGALAVSFGSGWLQPRLSLGVRAGYAWMNGIATSTATTGDHQRGIWGGPELGFELAAWSHARVHPVLALSLGAHLFGVRGKVDDGRDIKATGLWSGLSLGAAVR